MDTEGFTYIDPTQLSISAKTAIVGELKNALTLFKQQDDKLYNFLISPDYKRISQSNKESVNAFEKGVIFRLQDKLRSAKKAFELLGMKGGGLFSFMSKTKPPSDESKMELLLTNLEDSIVGEKIKFNSLLNSIKLYIFDLEDKKQTEEQTEEQKKQNEEQKKQRAELLMGFINTKMATFDVIINEVIDIIKEYNRAPAGGRKRKTHRRKHNNKVTKRRL